MPKLYVLGYLKEYSYCITFGADDFIRALNDEHRAGASMHRYIAAVSAFFTWSVYR